MRKISHLVISDLASRCLVLSIVIYTYKVQWVYGVKLYCSYIANYSFLLILYLALAWDGCCQHYFGIIFVDYFWCCIVIGFFVCLCMVFAFALVYVFVVAVQSSSRSSYLRAWGSYGVVLLKFPSIFVVAVWHWMSEFCQGLGGMALSFVTL